MKGQIISGKYGEIFIRQKSGSPLEIGELLVADNTLLQVYDLEFSSQISKQNIEYISGLKLEDEADFEFIEPNIRNYTLGVVKGVINLNGKLSKSMPNHFSMVREVKAEDLDFLSKPENNFFVGNLRSGSKKLDVDVFLDGKEVFSHHVLIPATTGRGKSNLTSCVLFDSIDKDYVSHLVLDPHDEYYGRNKIGLKDHPHTEKVIYYTPNELLVGARSLKINVSIVRPEHFNGVVDWTLPQKEALNAYFKTYGSKWIESILIEKPLKMSFNEGTLGVVKRRIMSLLGVEYNGEEYSAQGIFDFTSGKNTINDIVSKLEDSCTVIIDTSGFSGSVELLIGSIISSEVFNKYKYYRKKGISKPIVSIVLEEAPRVLGKDILERGSNIFGSIAREGRKFGVGLFAITQLPSLIPREILANINTKIILGIEMAPERQAIIDSASQDLSKDARAIASLDKGEAIITSNFSKFAIPVKIPYFNDLVEKYKSSKKDDTTKSFNGVKF